ncbi:MAG TPA: type II toxin-antitoxin system VapC family toxin [Caldilineae bacterium]|nr:type II toxin-antitoxin system VapC family toxin [Caldilineae bacterium]
MSLDEVPGAYVVVDASVSLKWALDDEEAVDQAVALRDASVVERRFDMVVPSLWVYEVTNGLVTAVRRGRLVPEGGAQAMACMLALGIRLADPDPEDVYEKALRHGIAAYDAAYLALAEALDASLWTGDRRFYEKVGAATDRVHWIGDFPL